MVSLKLAASGWSCAVITDSCTMCPSEAAAVLPRKETDLKEGT